MSAQPSTNGHSQADAPPPAGMVPPHSLEAEQSVLGAMLLSERTHYAFVIEEGLRAEDFYRERHRLVYETMLTLFTGGEAIDVVTVSEHLRARGMLEQAGGQAEIDALTASVPAVGNLRQYAQIVRERALLRRLLTASYEIQASVHGHEAPPRDLVERAERVVLEVAHDDRQKDFRKVGEVLGVEIRKWQELSAEGRSLTGTPSGFADLDAVTGGFQPGNLIIIAARPAMGKCLTADALVYDPVTGARRRMDEVVRLIEGGEEVFVAATDAKLRLSAVRATAAFRNGVRPVFALTTRLGRRVVATANHPLLTLGGWRELGSLRPGDRIAVPRTLPRTPAERQAMPDHEVVMLAALVADGNLTQRTPRFCFGPDSPVLEDVEEAAAAFGAGELPSALCALCERHGLGATERSVPDAVLGLDERGTARFLSILLRAVGATRARARHVRYAFGDERLARDVQHLLVRLGVVASVEPPSRILEGRRGISWTVVVHAADAAALQTPALRTQANGACTPALAAIRAGRLASSAVAAPLAGPARRSATPPLMAELAEAIGDHRRSHVAESDLWWDEVVSIEAAGEAETYDITVPGDHNFVADDIVVHNSALVTNMAENVALNKERPRPVALFSLEMSEAELAQRFIASQASIKGDDLRKGRLNDEAKWKRVLRTAGEYDSAPLFVDDSSDVGLLDIRAKARRLHQQTQSEYGGLGLIIIDYLQLMRADTRLDSRVLQVGEMSRGLKILARELSVPVIALSQLSRAVEQRSTTDKRPQLSDLRESGSIEQDADLVMFIYRDEYYFPETTEKPGEGELIIAKHRNGGLGDIPLTFQHEYPRFLGMQRA
ncbi:MAG: replicative DNA helicase [Solirubrobacteraceae bacterium]